MSRDVLSSFLQTDVLQMCSTHNSLNSQSYELSKQLLCLGMETCRSNGQIDPLLAFVCLSLGLLQSESCHTWYFSGGWNCKESGRQFQGAGTHPALSFLFPSPAVSTSTPCSSDNVVIWGRLLTFNPRHVWRKPLRS